MATDSRLSKEVLRSKSTACLNFIIRLYSLGVSPVCCLNFRSKWRWHRQVSSASRRSDKSPLHRLICCMANSMLRSAFGVHRYKAWSRKPSMKARCSWMVPSSPSLSAKEWVNRLVSSSAFNRKLVSSCKGRFMKRSIPQGRKRIPSIWTVTVRVTNSEYLVMAPMK